ncbi:MAG: methionyl-tRNA formyltransferase [Actinobacteria bacterium]|nr:methionyl-tRNA formyltransferase [Actinomycetota bacterium]
MRAVFYGTPAEAVPVLAALLDVAEVALVVTQPDRPRGRSRRLEPPPVKVAAEGWGLPVAQPERASADPDAIRAFAPDVAVVAAYGQLLKPALLEVPVRGFVNVHYSLLPRWRGASPVVRAILAGDETTGVSIMQIDEGLDTGPVFAAEQTPILPGETGGGLTARLADLGARLLAATLPGIVDGSRQARPQDDSMATAAAKVRTTEAFVDPARHSTAAVLRAVRAFAPKPGAWGVVDGDRIKLRSAEASDPASLGPGIAEMAGDRVILGTRDGAVALLMVQPAGKGVMTAADWMRGRRRVPARFESPPE